MCARTHTHMHACVRTRDLSRPSGCVCAGVLAVILHWSLSGVPAERGDWREILRYTVLFSSFPTLTLWVVMGCQGRSASADLNGLFQRTTSLWEILVSQLPPFSPGPPRGLWDLCVMWGWGCPVWSGMVTIQALTPKGGGWAGAGEAGALWPILTDHSHLHLHHTHTNIQYYHFFLT